MSVTAEGRPTSAHSNRSRIPRVGDVSVPFTVQGDRIDVRIELRFSRWDPPEGLVVRVPRRGDGPDGEPHEFVGWLGLFGVLQSLADQVDQPPP